MEPQPRTRGPRPQLPTVGQIVTLCLILIAVVMWIVILLLGFQLQDRIDQNFRLIMELAQSAGAS